MKPLLCTVLILGGLACAKAETATADQAASKPSVPQSQDTVVAEVDGRRITMKDVDERWQANDAAERARVTQLLYQNRRNTLDLMIGDMLIENAAKAASASKDEYEKKEIAARLKPVTDDDVKKFYEENKDRAQGRSLEQLTGAIQGFLSGQRQAQARAQLVDDLKRKSASRIMLDPPRQTVDVSADDPSSGPANAPITVVEFSDYQCPYCARVVPTLSKLRQAYGDKIRMVFKDFPLAIHPLAPKAAEAAHCAGEQGKYWDMHDRLFANQQALAVPGLKETAAGLGLDGAKFGQCLDSGKYAAAIAEDMKQGEALGVQSTPTVYINGRPVLGAQPFELFQSVIDEELARK
jgi:protein-disulfide isomerase